MDIQNTPEPRERYPLLKSDIEVKRREMQQHSSSADVSGAFEELQSLQASVSGIVLPPVLSIVSEEEEEAPASEVYEVMWAIRPIKEYSYKLVCCRNQLGIGMSNPGPR